MFMNSVTINNMNETPFSIFLGKCTVFTLSRTYIHVYTNVTYLTYPEPL